MYAQVEKPKENRSRAVANSVKQKKSNGITIKDNRSSAFNQLNIIQKQPTYNEKYKLAKKFMSEDDKRGIWGSIKGYFGDGHFSEERKRKIDAAYDNDVTNIYKERRKSFANAAELRLDNHYKKELVSPHPYPGGKGNVKYLEQTEADKSKYELINGQLNKINNIVMGKERQPKDVEGDIMFVRSGSLRNKDSTYIAVKENVGDLKSQHSSFKKGANVASAGKLIFGEDNKIKKILASSGHYKPDKQSLMKYAEFGSQSGQFQPDDKSINWVTVNKLGKESTVKMSEYERIKAVIKWAEKNPKRND